jgi:hypothetical protein
LKPSRPLPDRRYEFVFEPPITTAQVTLEAVETTGGNTGAKDLELFVDSVD